ncbi:MAG: EAL domain-containing protein [Oscillospiraceae bacterium]|nr:EAL domain-containing protein [Oscillospiraceae bacterium]
MDADRKKRLDSLFEAFSIIAEGNYVYLCDMKEDVSRWSERAVDFFDLPGEYMKNAGAIWTEHLHPDDRDNYNSSIAAIFEGRDSGHDMQYRALAKDGSYAVCTCRGVVIRDADGSPMYFGGSIHNHGLLSFIDVSTGLRSLYGFFDDLQSSFWKQESFTVMMIGLTAFSNVNDLYGYSFGNSVLQALATLLQREFANNGAVYRLDGTKFAVISHSLSEEEMIAGYQLIRQCCTHRFYVEEERISLALNAGLLNVNTFDISTKTLYSCLKYAYYQSKNHKLGECVTFADRLTDDNRHSIERINTVRRSVAEGCTGFYLCYQPIVDTITEKLKGMEALIRWHDADYGIVTPNQFIPVLEEDSLYPELGKWILRTAMTEGRQLLGRYPQLVLNVNLSYTQLENTAFVKEVLDLLAETGFPPENLCLEITERCRILDVKLLRNTFGTLRSCGIRVALDDFGTGFSSLGILRELEVDTVKIDRDYVKNIVHSKADQSTVQFIASLAGSFGAKLCVEGVETAEMRNHLLRYRVDSLQGYYYSKPIPIAEFKEKYLA